MLRLLCLVLLCLALPALADPRPYRLDPAASQVTFSYVLGGAPGQGTMPIAAADLAIDFTDVSNSTARVTLDVTGTRTGAIFVTEALKGRSVLDAAAHPDIRFVSSSIAGSIRGGATVRGDVTIRGVTRPITLAAEIYRRRDSAEGDLSRLTVRLRGSVNRSAFGAAGFADLVADKVDLDILVRLVAL